MNSVQQFFLSHSWAVAMLVTMLISAWRMPTVRDRVAAWIPRLPKRAQWAAPLCIGMLAAAGQGFLDGLRGEELFAFAMSQGGQIGVEAIGFWHFWKRVRGTKLNPAVPIGLLIAVGLMAQGCQSLPWSKTAYDGWREACQKDLVKRKDVAANAGAKHMDLEDFVESVCEFSDVVAPYARTSDSGVKRLRTPGDEAVAAARNLGVMQ